LDKLSLINWEKKARADEYAPDFGRQEGLFHVSLDFVALIVETKL